MLVTWGHPPSSIPPHSPLLHASLCRPTPPHTFTLVKKGVKGERGPGYSPTSFQMQMNPFYTASFHFQENVAESLCLLQPQ